MAIARQVLSGSTEGMGIMVCATDSTIPGQTLHTGHTTTTTIDNVYLYAANGHTSCQVGLTIEWGSTASANEIQQFLAPESGLVLITPGMPILGRSAARVITAFATLSGVVSVFGGVDRIT